MDIEFKIIIKCTTDQPIGFGHALEIQRAMAAGTKVVAAKINLVAGGSVNAIASISVDGSFPTMVNINQEVRDEHDDKEQAYPR